MGRAGRQSHRPHLLGVALKLTPPEVDQEVARVRNAEECLLPDWLYPASLDCRRFRVRGFYTASPQLEDYFRATAWLKSIPLRLDRHVELEAAWQLARAQTREVLGILLHPPPPEAPDFMRGAAWQRKSANAMLAAWAQMRHTWALHAKAVWCTAGFTP